MMCHLEPAHGAPSFALSRQWKRNTRRIARSSSRALLVAALVTLASISVLGCRAAQADAPKNFGGQNVRLAHSGGSRRTFAPPDAPAQTAYGPSEGIDYDPWESFNEKTFWFDHSVFDRYLLKPVATGWYDVMPYQVIQGLGNAFNNLGVVKRVVNDTLQGRFDGAGRNLSRFLINSTVGIAGFVDVAGRLGIKKSNADMGQTLGVYGVGPGPYLVLPILPPLTARDAIGYGADSLMDPLSYFTPFLANVGREAGHAVNYRAAHLQLYQDVEETSIDLYAAVRNGYLQRRRKSVQDAIKDRRREEEIERSWFQ